MNTTYNLTAYAIYLPVVLTLTIVVSELLFKNAKIFMMDIFHQKSVIALATNSLFKIGFYLLNFGFALALPRSFWSKDRPANQTIASILAMTHIALVKTHNRSARHLHLPMAHGWRDHLSGLLAQGKSRQSRWLNPW